ncbi:hypothetical protein H0H92_010382 [Tricholoma furcatifolium]|nr:hypothetical protein H0H92_010382 [Tricholoma furcatifolium]
MSDHIHETLPTLVDFNPRKRVIRPPSAEYLSIPLVPNALGIYKEVPSAAEENPNVPNWNSETLRQRGPSPRDDSNTFIETTFWPDITPQHYAQPTNASTTLLDALVDPWVHLSINDARESSQREHQSSMPTMYSASTSITGAQISELEDDLFSPLPVVLPLGGTLHPEITISSYQPLSEEPAHYQSSSLTHDTPSRIHVYSNTPLQSAPPSQGSFHRPPHHRADPYPVSASADRSFTLDYSLHSVTNGSDNARSDSHLISPSSNTLPQESHTQRSSAFQQHDPDTYPTPARLQNPPIRPLPSPPSTLPPIRPLPSPPSALQRSHSYPHAPRPQSHESSPSYSSQASTPRHSLEPAARSTPHLHLQYPITSPPASGPASVAFPSLYEDSRPAPVKPRHTRIPMSPPLPILRRKGFWNRRGDHCTPEGYLVSAPHVDSYPSELAAYPENEYENHFGFRIAFEPTRPELPESLPKDDIPPQKPYKDFVIYVDGFRGTEIDAHPGIERVFVSPAGRITPRHPSPEPPARSTPTAQHPVNPGIVHQRAPADASGSALATSAVYRAAPVKPQGTYHPVLPAPPRLRRKGFWNRRGDHCTPEGYLVYAPYDESYPPELWGYPENEYVDHSGFRAAFEPTRPELPESLPRYGMAPQRPYKDLLDIANLNHSDPSLHRNLIAAAQRLAEKSGLYPKCYELDNVTTSDTLECSGSFADVYKGHFQGRAAFDVAHGLQFLHKSCVVHGDLKGPNILIDEFKRACIADFGLSSVSDKEILAWTSHSMLSSKGGSVRWQAPELFNPEGEEDIINTYESDIYAWACVAYEIFAGQLPLAHLSRDPTVMNKVSAGERPIRPVASSPSWGVWGLTESIWALMEACWNFTAAERPTVDAIIECLEKSLPRHVSKKVNDDTLSPSQFREMTRDDDETELSVEALERLLASTDEDSDQQFHHTWNHQT